MSQTLPPTTRPGAPLRTLPPPPDGPTVAVDLETLLQGAPLSAVLDAAVRS